MSGTPNKDKGISRMDARTTIGWYVRGYRNKKEYAKFFSDRIHGGKRKALQLAREYRDKLHAQLGKNRMHTRKRYLHKQNCRNKTGVIGVVRFTGTRGHLSYDHYNVSWTSMSGKACSTSFSIKKFGEKEAFNMAVAHREKMLKESYSKKELKKHKNAVPGVYRSKGVNKRDCPYDHYVTTWKTKDGVSKATSYAVKEHGEKKALKLAVAHRKRMMGR